MGAHDFSFTAIDGKPLDLKNLAGKPILLVNVASYCGFTPQYTDLQALHENYGPRGLVVLGVPCNDFGEQEPRSEGEIAKFCESMYDVTFPMTAKQKVIGPDAHDLYKWIVSEAGEGAADAFEDLVEHLGGETAGVRVVAGAVIAVGQQQAGRQRVQAAVDERVGAGRPHGQGAQDLIVGALAQRHQDPQVRHDGELGLQERPAGREFQGLGLVLGRQTSHGIGDAAVDEPQPVVRIGPVAALCEAEFQEGRVEEVAGIVAGKRPAGPVGALHARCQSDDQQPGVEFAERADRRILPVWEFALQVVAERREPRAARAVERRLFESLRGH